MANDYEAILYDVQNGIARVTLNRPDALNALTGTLLDELTQAFKAAKADENVRVLVITGAGRGFCAGQDLRANPESMTDLKNWLESTYRPMLGALDDLKKPSVAAVNGVAAGAGFSLALACDFRIATTKTKFVPAFGKIALVPDSGMSYFLPRLIGMSRALEIVATNRDVNGETALQWGLVNRLCQPEELDATVSEFAGQLAAVAPMAYEKTRRLFHRSSGLDLPGALTLEEEYQGQCGSSADFKEGLNAFEQKRSPQFRGK
jgi:2-(1,2-epoxy-1,2-dihydrophenyl)acetyl-CoA isomerase